MRMKHKLKWQIVLEISLILLSIGIYLLQYFIFHDAKNTLFYLFQDVAFLPLQVLLATLVINNLLIEKR
ncbi:hypothetical protein ASN18_0560 [Candidatus Magnetominusculus xianensis]|uniref:Uncharacterized protein n=1 Tax=Candidatus Magnetominusculus xianensis TaxID=1748249 RepID=A0ABR5SK91_9BACT|nr:hypothetical protein ASN18_0560 [Candidatus Magnetominusculus xianensis]